jgi:predicted peptidase
VRALPTKDSLRIRTYARLDASPVAKQKIARTRGNAYHRNNVVGANGCNIMGNETFRRLATLLFASLVASLALSQPYGSAGVQTAVTKSNTTAPYAYYEYLPADYDHTSPRKFGLMIFLHGAGEKGNGESELSRVVSGQWPTGFIANSGRTYPLIVLSPQCSDQVGAGPAHDDCGWWNQTRIAQFIAYAKARYNVDPNRIYATGLSMGGAGTVYAARGATADIAAIVPICGAESGVSGDSALADMPMWITHACNDTVVFPIRSWSVLDKVTAETTDVMSDFPGAISANAQNCTSTTDNTVLYNRSNAAISVSNLDGSQSALLASNTHKWFNDATSTNVDGAIRQRLTLYQSGGHNVWNKTYTDQNIMSWLFRQRLNQAPQICNLDVNGGGAFDLRDARAMLAWMLGFRGATLELLAGFNGTTAASIDSFLAAEKNAGSLDLDGDGVVDALTDGLMLLRIALGFADGAMITNKAINAAGSRGTWAGVRAHLANNCKLNSLVP